MKKTAMSPVMFPEVHYVYAPYIPLQQGPFKNYGEVTIQATSTCFKEEVQKQTTVLIFAFSKKNYGLVVSICNRFLSTDFFLENRDGFVVEYIPGHLDLGDAICNLREEPDSKKKFFRLLNRLQYHSYLEGLQEYCQDEIEKILKSEN